MKTITIIVTIALSLLLFLVTNLIHFQYFPVRVVLYDSLVDVLIAAAISAVLYLAILRRWSVLSGYEATLAILLSVLLAVNYSISVPTIIDRSLSMYILEKLQQRGGSIRQAAFDDVVKNEYLPEHRLIDIRLTEQLNSGTIVIENGCVKLTSRGDRIATFTRFFRTHILPKRREVMGQLTDDLTDPFRDSRTDVDYKCSQ